MFRNFKISRIVLPAALIAAALPVTAGAVETHTVMVHTGDLNLASDSGRATLHARVDHAVHKVCDGSGPDLAVAQSSAACRQNAMATVMPQVDALLAAQGNRVASNQTLSVTSR